MTANTILTPQQVQHILRRIAYQIFETFVDEQSIVIAGISKNGFLLAEKIADEIRKIAPFQVELCEVFVDKKQPLNAVKTSMPETAYTNKAVVLVDDVLNSGTTLVYGVRHFLNVPLHKFKTAVLVDRNHKKYPVKADFKGLSLSTSHQEHVQVEWTDEGFVAYLS